MSGFVDRFRMRSAFCGQSVERQGSETTARNYKYNNYYYYDFLCANILEDQAQWPDKTKGLRKLVIVKQSVSYQRMCVGTGKPSRIDRQQ